MFKVEWKGVAAGILLVVAGLVGFIIDNPGLKLAGLFGVVVLFFFLVNAYRRRNKYDPQEKLDENKVVIQDLVGGHTEPPKEG